MAGYNYLFGMSNRAVDAYNSGLMPISKLTARDLKTAGLSITLAFAKWLAKEGHWHASEWHHASSHYNKVQFYDPTYLARLIVNQVIDIHRLKSEYTTARKAGPAQDKGQPVKGTYSIFSGSRRYARYEGEQEFTGKLIGNWIYLDGGGRKKANGNHIKFEYL